MEEDAVRRDSGWILRASLASSGNTGKLEMRPNSQPKRRPIEPSTHIAGVPALAAADEF
jgi:hypothetical protein